MKKCPRCSCVYRDETLNFCLEDGAVLVYSPDATEPHTAVLTASNSISGAPTWQNDNPQTSEDASSPGPSEVDQGIHRNPVSRSRIVAAVVAILSIAIAMAIYRYVPSKTDKQIGSIVILPFQNMTGQPDVDYVSDGISESLINSLTELGQLRVIARSTAFRYKGRDIEPGEVGRALNVRAVLMGEVRRFSDRVNIQVDLIDAETGTQLWGQAYERPNSDLLSIKQSIAREITQKLRIKFSDEQNRSLNKKDTENSEAYQLYLKGRFFWNKRTPEGITKAIDQFEKAVELDPDYALGYVGLADCYLLFYTNVPPDEAIQKGRAAIDRALSINPLLAEAHASSGQLYYDSWQWNNAEKELERAVELNPNYATAHQWLGGLYLILGKFADAEMEYARAQELDPLSPIIGSNVALLYILKRDPDRAIEESKKILDLNPDFPFAFWCRGWAFVRQHRYDEAGREFESAVEKSDRASYFLSTLANFYVTSGRRKDALALLKELEERYEKGQATGYDVAGVYIGLADKDKAFAWLEKDLKQRRGELPGIVVDLRFESIRTDPRYTDLVRRMGLS